MYFVYSEPNNAEKNFYVDLGILITAVTQLSRFFHTDCKYHLSDTKLLYVNSWGGKTLTHKWSVCWWCDLWKGVSRYSFFKSTTKHHVLCSEAHFVLSVNLHSHAVWKWAIVTKLVQWCNSDQFLKNYATNSYFLKKKPQFHRMFHSNIIHKLWVWGNAKQFSKSSVWCEVQGLLDAASSMVGSWPGGAASSCLLLSWVYHSTSWCSEDLTTSICSGRDMVKIELLFMEHFVQAEIY